MLRTRIFACVTALLCMAGTILPAIAAETDCDTVYCFSQEDFSQDTSLSGICITDLPDKSLGTVLLGNRVIRPGDILTADQIAAMTFSPAQTRDDRSVSVTYLPIFSDRVESAATLTLSIRGKEDKAPIAEDSAHETYKNLPLEGKLKVSDPEGQALTITVTRNPRRGQVTVQPDGSFTYTPAKNKVGVDSFTYTATDPAGNVSREATVTIQLLKPTDTALYTDTLGRECRFAAEWMKNTGIFTGERIGDNPCFGPDRQVTRGEFVTMLVKTLDIPLEAEASRTGYTDEVPLWLQPYLAAAVRSGLTAGLPDAETFGAEQPITGAEAAVMLQNALSLPTSQADTAAVREAETSLPAWAADALTVMAGNGFMLPGETELTREQVALCLYRAVQLKDSAPGMAVLRAG